MENDGVRGARASGLVGGLVMLALTLTSGGARGDELGALAAEPSHVER